MTETVVTVPYREWIGYNILKDLSKYPLPAALVIGTIVGLLTYYSSSSSDTYEHKPHWIISVAAFGLAFIITYAVLWYYGTTLFA